MSTSDILEQDDDERLQYFLKERPQDVWRFGYRMKLPLHNTQIEINRALAECKALTIRKIEEQFGEDYEAWFTEHYAQPVNFREYFRNVTVSAIVIKEKTEHML